MGLISIQPSVMSTLYSNLSLYHASAVPYVSTVGGHGHYAFVSYVSEHCHCLNLHQPVYHVHTYVHVSCAFSMLMYRVGG